MNTDQDNDWEQFVSAQLEDPNFAFNLLDEAAIDAPPGHFFATAQEVLAVHPSLGPMVVSRYAPALKEAELNKLADAFESVATFLKTYSYYVAALPA